MPKSGPGASYLDDTYYGPIEASLERKYGLPSGLLGRIRKYGERSNADQVSEAGARSAYQITPTTRNLVEKRYGVNAYAGNEAAAETAALLLKESLGRNKQDVTSAVREYVGGTNPENWGPVTRAYVGRVTGHAAPAAISERNSAEGYTPLAAPSFEEVWRGTEAKAPPRTVKTKTAEQIAADLTKHSPLWDAVGQLGGITPVVAGPTLGEQAAAASKEGEVRAAQEQAAKGTALERAGAMFSQNWSGFQIWRGIDRDANKFDPNWTRKFQANYDTYMKDVDNGDDWDDLLSGGGMHSEAEFNAIRNRQREAAHRQHLIASTDHPIIYSFGTTLLDPVGWLATAVVGKAIQIGKFAVTGVKAARAGLGATAAEGAITNSLLLGAADYGGERVGIKDYAFGIVAGAGIGAAIHSAFSPKVSGGQLAKDYTTVWQGSASAPFEKHSSKFLGTGEGNFAFGKGHYFTENFKIGRWYWNTLSGNTGKVQVSENLEGLAETFTKDRGWINGKAWADLPQKDLAEASKEVTSGLIGKTWDAVVEWLKQFAVKTMNTLSNRSGLEAEAMQRLHFQADFAQRLADRLEQEAKQTKGGTIYKVRLRNADTLNLDTAVGDQPNVAAKLTRARLQFDPKETGAELYSRLAGVSATKDLKAVTISNAGHDAATASLREAGIAGNKYLSGPARAKGRAEYNYVSFVDEDIQIEQHWTPETGWVERGLDDLPTDTALRLAALAVDREAQAHVDDLEATAKANLPADASDEAIEAEMTQVLSTRIEEFRAAASAPRPDTDRFLPTPDIDIADAPISTGLEQRYNLANWTDPAEKNLAARAAAQIDNIVAAAGDDVNKGLEGRLLKIFGAESDALTLLRSKNPVAQAVVIQLLESTTGAGGRKPSAAISMVLHERQFMQHLVPAENAFQMWRAAEGKGAVSSLITSDARREFDRLVYAEIEQRGVRDVANITDNTAIRLAADAHEAFYDNVRGAMQSSKALGHERLGDTSRGYVTRLIDARKLLNLTQPQLRQVEAVVSKQFQELNSYTYVNEAGEKITKGFDPEFSDKLAKRYFAEAMDRSKGTTFVPANLHTSQAAEIITDTLKAIGGLSPEQQKAILGKFSRGGASFTKGRLNLDLSAEIGDGMRLQDLFSTDLTQLARDYGRKAAGQVALAQYGVYGRPGVDLLRRLLSSSTNDIGTLKAFDRVMSEFLQAPAGKVGEYDWAFKNLRNITSAARLGGMAFPQLAEFANAVPMLGVKATFSSIASLPRMVKSLRAWRKGQVVDAPILGDFDQTYGFIGSDNYVGHSLFETRESGIDLYGQESLGLFSRVAAAGSNLNAIASGFRLVHAVQVRGLSEAIVRKAIRYIHLGEQDIALAEMGLSEGLRDNIKKALPTIAEFDKRGNLVKFTPIEGGLAPKDLAELAQVIERGSGQIIQKTYTGETGAWAHSEQLKLLTQFRTFGITSIEKQFGRTVAARGYGSAFMVMVGAMGFAFPIHLARVKLAASLMDEQKGKEYIEEHTTLPAMARALQNYVSISGLAPDAEDVLATVATSAYGDAPEWLKTDFGSRGRVPTTGSYIPALGYLNDAMESAVNVPTAVGTMTGLNDKPDPVKKIKKAMKLLPGSNLPITAALLNGVSDEEGE